MKSLSILSLIFFCFVSNSDADQFVLFDKVFTFEAEDAVPTKSHLFVKGDELGEGTPQDWTAPVDYRNGTVHVRIEVMEKPEGDAPTVWSLCYIPNKGQKNNYGCTNTPTYTKEGVYEKDVKMTEFWENDSIIWTEGIKHMSLVIKNSTKGGKGHAHLEEDLSMYFPTKIRVTMVQVSKGATYDASLVPGLEEK
ncbi:MAG: hypothetical protein CMO55_19275 [Verrucomicrobiales bacterium]|nr:hypothetical protein [Verrucomicrobiales bacterium]